MLGGLSETQMVAISLANQVFFIYSITTYGFSLSASMIISQYWGKGDVQSIKQVVTLSLRCNIIFGTAISFVVAVFPSLVMRIFTTDSLIISEGSRYLRIAAFSYLPYAVSNTTYQCIRAVEQAFVVAISNIITFSLNVLFSYILIFGHFGFPAIGIAGAAIAAVMARFFEVSFMSVFMSFFDRRIRYNFRLLLRNMKFVQGSVDPGRLRRDYFRTVKPALGHEVIWSMGISATQAVLGHLDIHVIAVYSVCYVFFEIMTAPLNALGVTAITVIGKSIGAEKEDKLKQEAYTLMFLSTIIGIIGFVSLLLFGRIFSNLYLLSEPSKMYVRPLMAVMSAVVFFSAWEIVGLVGILRGGGSAKVGFYTDIFSMWIIAIPLGIVSAFLLKFPPILVIIILKIDMPIKSMIGFINVLQMKWVNNLTREKIPLLQGVKNE
jgi:putative MATE family efflux protein